MTAQNDKGSVVVHMGYVRSGTTLHQRKLFSGNKDIHYIGKPFDDESVLTAFRNLACSDTSTFDETESRKILQQRAALPPQSEASCVMLSDEILLSQFSTDMDVLLQRLQSTFGNIRVLLTIREQFQTFRSWCEHVLEKREYGCLETIMEYQYKFRFTKGSMISYLDYHSVLMFLCDKLGRDRVLMLPYELLLSDRQLYGALLADFLGVPRDSIEKRLSSAPVENARGTSSEIRFFDFKKRHLFPQRDRRLDRLGAKVFEYLPIRRGRTERLVLKLQDRFKDDFAVKNVALRRALLERIGVDIAALGYSLPPEADAVRSRGVGGVA